jgi:sarcosine oxidase
VPAREREAVKRVRTELPAFDATPIRSEVCAWTESDDDLFVLDRVGDVVLGCGDSGQGFKFLPTFGPVLADLAEGRAVSEDVAALGLGRFTSGEGVGAGG